MKCKICKKETKNKELDGTSGKLLLLPYCEKCFKNLKIAGEI